MTKSQYMTRRALWLAAAAMLAASPAYADPGKSKGHGNDKSHHEREYKSDDDGTTLIRIGDDDRVILRGYIDDHYKSNCPPGLAKKHNGCLPPGQAKKRYEIGHRLSDDIAYEPVPRSILDRLHPAPSGYKYVKVDTDVLLIGEATKNVIDAVTLLSGVGKQ